MITVGSVCSGIGGMDLGFADPDFEILWMCERDVACQKVLRRHFPAPIYDDLSLIHGASACDAGGCLNCVADVDVLIGGTPCQSFSMAGRREGMDGESGLFLHFARLVSEIAPKWLLWENVPGVLSLDNGEVFADIIELLSGTRPTVPPSGWGRSGFGWGTQRGVAWRILDAQHFGVPQRRRRVFFVGHLGAPWSCAAEVLFEPDSRPRDPSEGGEEGEDAAPDVADRARGDGPVSALTANGVGTCGPDDNQAQAGHLIPVEAFQCHGNNVGPMGTLRQGNGAVTGGVPFVVGDGWDDKVARTLTSPANGPHYDLDTENWVVDDPISKGIPFRKARRAQTSDDVETWVEEDVANTLNVFDVGNTRTTTAIVEPAGTALVRRLTPVEATRLQGFPDDWVAPDADAEEAHTRQVLHGLWQTVGEEAREGWRSRVALALLTPEVLLAGVYVGWVPWEVAGKCATARGQVPGEDSWPEDFVYSLREHAERGSASSRWQSAQQLITQLGRPVSVLSSPRASREGLQRAGVWEEAQRVGLLRYALPEGEEVRHSKPLKISDSSAYKQLGNAVAVPCAQWIADRLADTHCRIHT